MIGLVIVSHSFLIAEGTKELALQMADPALKIIAAGGTSDGKLGTDMKKIKSAIEKVNGPEGVLILTDLGSSVLTTEMVIDMLDEDNKDISKIKIANAPLVEGSVVAAVEASFGKDIFSIKKNRRKYCHKEGSHLKKLYRKICTAFIFIVHLYFVLLPFYVLLLALI